MADENSRLFSEEVMASMEAPNLFNQQNDGPVTVLGKTFANDAERRAYFREELRKKLPELKQIEGFPIGEDDDIINLSDPPYYTACPNPWLNDFIAEWEEEKKQLIKEGKRVEEKEVTEPYAGDVSEGKNNPIYMAHGYHTKVPHPAIMRYILHYTEPGDIIYDGFSGGGMTGVASSICASKSEVDMLDEENAKVGARHGIVTDLAPICSLVSSSYNTPFQTRQFITKANAILDKVDAEYGWMYETKVNGILAKINYVIWSDVFTCPNCANELNLWKEAVDLESNIIKDSFSCPLCGYGCTKRNMEKTWETYMDPVLRTSLSRNKKVPVRVNYSINGKRGEKNADIADRATIERIESLQYDNLYSDILPEGEKTRDIYRSNRIKYVNQFYTFRNYLYLSKIRELIEDDVVLLAWFTSVQQNATNMYKFRTDRKGGILNGTFFIPSLSIEQNPSKLLRSKIRNFASANYEGRGNGLASLSSATDLRVVSDNSIDYIFLDPPFGANIMYSELNSIWENWLRVKTNNGPEAIINPIQNKALFDYQDLMNRSFKEFYRILKPGKWLTIEFSNTSASVWNSIQNALQGVGFVVANVAAIDKQQGSFNAVTTTTAVKQDLIITCFKPTQGFVNSFEADHAEEKSIWEFVDEYINHLPVHLKKNNTTTAVIERSPKILYDRLISYYVQKGFPVPVDASIFQSGLRERYIEKDGMFFTASQAIEYDEKKKSAPEFAPMGLVVSNEADGIEWLRLHLSQPKTYQEIQPDWMQAINGIRKYDILPELRELLEENFIQEPDGKWRLPNIQDDVDKAALRTRALLREFEAYKEIALKPRGRIGEARVEALRAGFKQCYINRDFQTIVTVGQKIPQNLLTEDEILLQFYDIAVNHI